MPPNPIGFWPGADVRPLIRRDRPPALAPAPTPRRGPPIRLRRTATSPSSTRHVGEARCRPSPPISQPPPSARAGSTPTPLASARAASAAAVHVAAGRRKAGCQVQYLCPCRDLHPSFRTTDCGLCDGCPSLSSPPLFGPRVTISSLFFVCFRLDIPAPATARAASSCSPSKSWRLLES